MSSLPSIDHGTLSAPPDNTLRGDMDSRRGSLRGAIDRTHGTLHGGAWDHGTLLGNVPESPVSSAIAELQSLISTIGSLSAQAQSLPLSPPSTPSLPQDQSYRPQTTDYTQFVDDTN